MATRFTYLLSIGFIAAAAVGCGTSATARFYTLRSTATAGDPAPARFAVLVGPVSLPPAVDRPQFVVQVAPNRVELDEFNRWAAPLDDSIARAVAGDLALLLGTPDVSTGSVGNATPAYQVTIDVQRFDSIPGDAALIEAAWVVRKTKTGETRPGRTVAREALQGTDFDALAAAHSRALASVSGDIAVAIRALVDADVNSTPAAKSATRSKGKAASSKGQRD